MAEEGEAILATGGEPEPVKVINWDKMVADSKGEPEPKPGEPEPEPKPGEPEPEPEPGEPEPEPEPKPGEPEPEPKPGEPEPEPKPGEPEPEPKPGEPEPEPKPGEPEPEPKPGEPEPEPEEIDPSTIDLEIGDEKMTVAELASAYQELKEFKESIDKDEFFSKLHQYYKNTGNLTPYLESQLIDYGKRSDLEMLRMQSDGKYDGLPDRSKVKAFKKDMIAKYGFDTSTGEFVVGEENSDIDLEFNQDMMKRDADELRNKLKKQQEEFKIPEKKADTGDQEAAQKEREQRQTNDKKWRDDVDSNDFSKNLLETGKIEIGGDGDKIGLEVKNAKELVEMAIDQKSFFKLFKPRENVVDLELWYRVTAFAQDVKAYDDTLIQHGKTLATEARLKESSNIVDKRPSNRQGVAGATSQKSESKELLTEFLKSGKTVIGD